MVLTKGPHHLMRASATGVWSRSRRRNQDTLVVPPDDPSQC